MELLPGSKVDRYEVVSLLSRGVLFTSYAARDPQLGRDVVLKEYFPAGLALRRPGGAVGPRAPEAAQDFADGLARFVADGHSLENPSDASRGERVLALLEANGTTYVVSERLSETPARRTPPPTRVQAQAPQARRSRALVIAAAAACVLVIGTLVLLVLRGTGPAPGLYDGRYVGIVQFGTLRKVELSIAGTSGRGSTEHPACGPVRISVEVSDQGRVTGIYEGYETDYRVLGAPCTRSTSDVTGEIKDQRIDLALSCKSCMGAGTAAGTLFRLATIPRAQDGSWSVVHTCPGAGAVQGFTNGFPMTVKDGWATAQWNTPGQRDSLTFAGQIRPDGAVAFSGYGRRGPAAQNPEGQAEGTPFIFAAVGRFGGSEGRATVTGRDCTLAFARTGA